MRRTFVLLLLAVAVFAIPALAGEEKAVESTKGQVTSVDAGAKSLTVQPSDEGSQSLILQVDEHTKIMRDGKAAGLDAINKGDKVKVDYKKDDHGHLIAVMIGIG